MLSQTTIAIWSRILNTYLTVFKLVIWPTYLCDMDFTGDRNGAGPCSGDSGGGLYMLDNGKWRLRGVVSVSLRPQNGEASCNLDEYIIFTDTAQYLTWIRNIISQNYFD